MADHNPTRNKYISAGLCYACGNEKPESNRRLGLNCLEVRRKYYKNNTKFCKQIAKSYRESIRKRTLEHYGPFCSCCGEDNYRFLTIDHINNDGLWRSKNKERPPNKFYASIVKQGKEGNWPSDLQILCYNCNCGRAFNSGICPHKDE